MCFIFKTMIFYPINTRSIYKLVMKLIIFPSMAKLHIRRFYRLLASRTLPAFLAATTHPLYIANQIWYKADSIWFQRYFFCITTPLILRNYKLRRYTINQYAFSFVCKYTQISIIIKHIYIYFVINDNNREWNQRLMTSL